MIVFANPLGFLALLGLPAVLLIHFLQRQSQVVTVSTLFLLETLDRESIRGRKFDRLRNSIPLWLQLLGVLLLTWILVQPAWIREQSVQKIGIVLDTSASMDAFRQEVAAALRDQLPRLNRGARTVELIALESHIEGRPLYNGASVDGLLAALDEWNPSRPAHDPGPALRVGRSLAGSRGILLYVTDHPVSQPGYDARVLSVGEPLENVGFAGVSIDSEDSDGPLWEVLVKNYGATPQSREWFLQTGRQRTPVRSLDLAPGEVRTLRGRFPDEADAITLNLSPDRFASDDLAPVRLPRPKTLWVTKNAGEKVSGLADRILGTFENVQPASAEEAADLVLTTYNPLSPTQAEPVSIVFLAQLATGRRYFPGPIVASNHPLVAGLNWQGLIARSGPGMPVGPDDSILLWQGDRALIFLRTREENRQLIFNFDVPSSNVEQLPSFIVLIHRFVESIRDDKVAPHAANVELSQPLYLAHHRDPDAPALEWRFGGERAIVPLNQTRSLRAPDRPGFFEVLQGEATLFSGAAHFADTREADFSGAGPLDELDGLRDDVVEEHLSRDAAWQIWLLAFVAILLASWYFLEKKRNPRVPAGAAA